MVQPLFVDLRLISIHALREEGDFRMPPSLYHSIPFLSTPSARRATQFNRFRGVDHLISIHALREEGDTLTCERCGQSFISIHALREEGDLTADPIAERMGPFLSTPSARRATNQLHTLGAEVVVISIHALREEGDVLFWLTDGEHNHFYPRPPRGGRPDRGVRLQRDCPFLSTPSARRAT